MDFDFIIKGGSILDGSKKNALLRQGDIGIKGDRIKAIGSLSGASTERAIDVRGFYVCPGFIDTHSHSEFTLLADGRAEGKISQGVTTEINGNCGLSAAPLYNSALEHRIDELKELGIEERWNTFSQYFAILSKRGFATNFLTLTGHGNLRASVLGYSDRQLTSRDRDKIFYLLRDSLASGAIGLSTGLVYPPGAYSDTSELIDLAHETALQGGIIYTTHMRSEGDKLLESVDEAIKTGFGANLHVHISHLKTSDEKNWGKIKDVFQCIDNARQKGLSLTCDRYPYIASCTSLDAILPSWAFEGGKKKELKRLKSKREDIKRDILNTYPGSSIWKDVTISSVTLTKNKWMEGKSLIDLSVSLNKTPLGCLFDILIEEDLKVSAIFFLMNEDNLKSILKRPYTMIGSDSSARGFGGITANGKPHPRTFGTFPRVLGRYVREQGILTLSEAIYKMTGLPAKTFGIKGRGVLSEGFFADITIFDPKKVNDKADFNEPFYKPEGIYYVFVNGEPVLFEGKLTGALPGRILR